MQASIDDKRDEQGEMPPDITGQVVYERPPGAPGDVGGSYAYVGVGYLTSEVSLHMVRFSWLYIWP